MVRGHREPHPPPLGERARPGGSDSWSLVMIGITLALAVCGGIIAAGRRFLPQGRGVGMQVVGRVSLSPKHSVYLLRVGRRVLARRGRASGITLLISELDDLAEIEPDAPPGDQTMRTSDDERHPRSTRRPVTWPWPICRRSGAARDSDSGVARPTSPAPEVPRGGPDRRSAVEPQMTGRQHSSASIRPSTQETASPVRCDMPALDRADAMKTVQTVALFGLISLAPMGLLMVTAFVRINIVLILLRQALGSPQVPGNQVLTALALLLTALVMRPLGEESLS